jgi:hypothetical protein
VYLVDCKSCRTEFANEARMCPRCGHLRHHVSAEPNQSWDRIWPAAESGESHWDRRR